MGTPHASEPKVLVSADGTEIYADAVGDPTKLALVFIHGFALSSMVFDSIFNDPLWADQVYLVGHLQ
jgi:pimeloyl-ACP methyl ester carboxylesterase